MNYNNNIINIEDIENKEYIIRPQVGDELRTQDENNLKGNELVI